MGRKAYIPLEIDFIFGLDDNDFLELSLPERMTYIYIWSYIYHSSRPQSVPKIEVQKVLKRYMRSTKYLDKWLTNMRTNNLIEYDGITCNFLGLERKRKAALRRRVDQNVHQKGDQSVPHCAPKVKESKVKESKESVSGTPKEEFSKSAAVGCAKGWQKKSRRQGFEYCVNQFRIWIANGKDPLEIMADIAAGKPDMNIWDLYPATQPDRTEPEKDILGLGPDNRSPEKKAADMRRYKEIVARDRAKEK